MKYLKTFILLHFCLLAGALQAQNPTKLNTGLNPVSGANNQTGVTSNTNSANLTSVTALPSNGEVAKTSPATGKLAAIPNGLKKSTAATKTNVQPKVQADPGVKVTHPQNTNNHSPQTNLSNGQRTH